MPFFNIVENGPPNPHQTPNCDFVHDLLLIPKMGFVYDTCTSASSVHLLPMLDRASRAEGQDQTKADTVFSLELHICWWVLIAEHLSVRPGKLAYRSKEALETNFTIIAETENTISSVHIFLSISHSWIENDTVRNIEINIG